MASSSFTDSQMSLIRVLVRGEDRRARWENEGVNATRGLCPSPRLTVGQFEPYVEQIDAATRRIRRQPSSCHTELGGSRNQHTCLWKNRMKEMVGAIGIVCAAATSVAMPECEALAIVTEAAHDVATGVAEVEGSSTKSTVAPGVITSSDGPTKSVPPPSDNGSRAVPSSSDEESIASESVRGYYFCAGTNISARRAIISNVVQYRYWRDSNRNKTSGLYEWHSKVFQEFKTVVTTRIGENSALGCHQGQSASRETTERARRERIAFEEGKRFNVETYRIRVPNHG